MQRVSVKYPNTNKKYTFNLRNLEVAPQDYVVVDTVNGECLGIVMCEGKDKYNGEEIRDVVRKATKTDIENYEENLKKAKKAKKRCQEIAKKYNLEMKIVSVEYNLDCSKLLVSFVSENRVDFRDLVKELATEFKARIELRQIGPRDETKIVGGLGPCGQPCCCKKFLDDCEHATIKMAKTQNLSLNPTKISGLCGKLMCCLAYENEHYAETVAKMPKINSEVTTPDGKGIVVYNDILKEVVSVRFNKDDTQEIKEYKLADIK